ncbi:uncharacterized protein LOC113360149 [Papaver somniferum]|uniref:uncharacterized protein LOC113360149 n=1 Tax=Papaver somniferum TaxID=3469 RepID=UPI000E7012A0|nr:uncharacterized protein LOC113360149 [Papaver somniferum]
MVTVREDMKDGCCWSVMTREDINVWTDPWVPGLINNKPEKTDDEESTNVKVKELIIQEEHRWDENKMQQLFNQIEVTKIMEIHLPKGNTDDSADKLLWPHHPKGEFSSKSFLKTMNDRKRSTSTNSVFPWKKFWNVKNIPPRIQIFLWRLLKNGLPVAQSTRKHIHGINDNCSLCDRSVESTEHPFLTCQTTQVILFASHLSLRTGEQPNISIPDYIKQWLEEGEDYAKLKMVACFWWAIWKIVNVVVFNKERCCINSVIKEAMYWYNMEVTVDETETMPTESDYLESSKDSWEPPNENRIKINFDGAAGPKGYACGAVTRDNVDAFHRSVNRYFTYCTAVEPETYMLAVELAKRKAFRNIVIQGDSLVDINALKHRQYKPNWCIQ